MRYLTPFLMADLEEKMVLLGGPRQCGKTTLARAIGAKLGSSRYFNWDAVEQRRAALRKDWSSDDRVLIFDEIHKVPRWKTWLKGTYDTRADSTRILVTGSARLDVYRRGGDSMLGRYHYWRLHPFTLSELPAGMAPTVAFERLMRVGGFPEPFLRGDSRFARRWRRERTDRVIRDDLRDLENVQQLAKLELFVEELRRRVGSLVVLANIAADLEVAPKTLKHWLELLERMYLVFCVYPWTRGIGRAVRKPPKVYFWDNADVVGDQGAVFENLVATHLLKRIHFLEDRDGHRFELRYVRDKDGREVDFLIAKDGAVTELWEAKWSDQQASRALVSYAERLKPERATQVVAELTKSRRAGRLRVATAIGALSSLEG